MLNKKPKISVLILTFNHGQFIEATLSSVADQKSEQFDLEILLTDDGSSDDTLEKVEKFKDISAVPIKIFAKEHRGVCAIASNFLDMINLSCGDYISFLAGDDQFMPARFVEQLQCFDKDSNLVISYADGISCVDGSMVERTHSEEMANVLSCFNAEAVYQYITSRVPVLFIQSALAKTDFLKKVQPFDRDLIADDWVFNVKVFEKLRVSDQKFNYIPTCVFIRNIHGDNASRDLVTHYKRIGQVADRYGNNARVIRSEFISNAIVLSIRRKNINALGYFLKKNLFYPESGFKVLVKFVFSISSYLFGRKRLG